MNDINGDLVALYRNVQYHVDAIVSEIEFSLNARQNLIEFKEQKGLTEIQRAGRWFVRNKISWGGNCKSFGCQGARASRRGALEDILSLHERLDRTVIESVPYQQCLRTYDLKETFFFLDPPYLGAEPGAYRGWTLDEMKELRQILDGLKGKWLLTVDDSAGTREVFDGLHFRTVSVVNKLNQLRLGKGAVMRELIITPAE